MNPFLNGKEIFSKRRPAYIPFNTSIITTYTEPCILLYKLRHVK